MPRNTRRARPDRIHLRDPVPAPNRPAHSAGQRKRPGTKETVAHSVAPFWAIHLCLVAVMAFAVYSNTLFNGFVDDDEAQVLRNPWIQDLRFIPDMFSKDVWSFLRGVAVSNYYRPLMHVIYLVNYHLFGFQAWGFHLVNVLFHVANTIMVFLLTTRLPGGHDASGTAGPGRFVARLLSVPFLAALLFATHPIHTEAVAWIASIPELSFTLLSLLSLCCYIAASGPFAIGHWLSVATFFVALLFKETALTLPVLVVGYDLAFRTRERPLGNALKMLVPYLLAAVVYFIMRHHALTSALVAASQSYGLTTSELLANAFPLFSEYLAKLLLPFPLNFWHSFHPIASLLSPTGGLSLLTVAVFLAFIVLAFKKDRTLFFALLLIAVPLLPALYIKGLPRKPFAERYLYLPSVGFVIVAARFLCGSVFRERRTLRLLIPVGIVVLYSAGTWARNSVWRDPITLFSDTVKNSPDAAVPRYDLAIALANHGRVDEALAHYQILVEANPRDAKFQSALGSALLLKERVDEAIEHLKLTLAVEPDSLETHNDLGIALRRKGLLAEAIAEYQKTLAIDPGYADAHYNLGVTYADAGRMEEAMEHLRSAVKLRPDSAYYRNSLGIECGKQGLVDEAIEQFREAVRLDPQEPAYRRNRDRAEALRGSAGR